MMNEQNTFDREELETLLPWYATAKLDAADMARVEAALKTDPNLQAQLALIEEDRHEAILQNEALGLPSAGLANKLMARIEAESPAPSAIAQASRGFIGRIGDFVAGLTSKQLGYAAVAAALLVAIQAAVITGQAVNRSGNDFKTASHGEQTAGLKAHLLLAFEPTADLSEIEKVLGEHDAKIVEGPLPGGMYKIHLGAKTDGKAEITKAITALSKQTDVVKMALPLPKGQ